MRLSEIKTSLLERARQPGLNIPFYKKLGNGEYVVYGQIEAEIAMMRYQSIEGIVIGYKTGNGKETWFVQGIEESTALHRHDYVELGYVLEGTAVQSFSGKEYAFQKGDFWISDRSCIHSDCFVSEELFTIILSVPGTYFNPDFFGNLEDGQIKKFFYNALRQQEHIRQFLHFTPTEEQEKEGLNQKIQTLLEWLVEEIAEEKPGWHQIANGLMLRLLHSLTEHFSVQFVNQQKLKISSIVYQEIAAYIREHYSVVTRQEISLRFHYSEDFICKIIKEHTGLTFQKFLQNIRLEEAARLLRETDYSVDQVIHEVGYQNRGYFYQIFIKEYGNTPSEWRKQNF